MAERTNIEWCDATVNWWVGCTQISPGCDHCYAKRIAAPFWGQKWGPGVPLQRFEGALETLKALDRKAQRLGRRLVVFHNSVSDMFDKDAPDGWRMDAFEGMAATPNLIHLVLTKRIGNVRPYLQRDSLAFDLIGEGRVWLGITVCNQEEADRDIPKLLHVPAEKRFLSCEPLLGPVDLSYWVSPTVHCGACGEYYPPSEAIPDPSGHLMGADKCAKCGHENVMGTWWGEEAINEASRPDGMELDEWDSGYRLHWVIVGGESGPGARPMHPDWVRSLRDQCQAACVPFLFKQWGEWMPPESSEATYQGRDWREVVDATGEVRPVSYVGDRALESSRLVVRVGKKAAGRRLDGVEHNGRPA